MMRMPCKTKCVYQSNGICELESSIPEGLSADERCIHFIPLAAAQRGSPHRYFEPGSNAYRQVQTTNQRDAPGSGIS